MINRKRMLDEFLELVRIDSPSRREGAIGSCLARKIGEMGGDAGFDEAGRFVNGEVGNLVARFKGEAALEPILLSAHMDTVMPGEGVRPVVDDRIIRSDGTTVLGGDDKSGIAIILEVVRKLREDGVRHGDIEIVFTVCEEAGLLGAKHFNRASIRSRYGLVLDSDDAGFLFTRAPAACRLEFTVQGLEAHAGMSPETGINAIQVASRAISGMKLGRIDPETTANLGIVQGGTAVNIVPARVTVQGEARSHDESKLKRQIEHMVACFQNAVENSEIRLDGRNVSGRLETRIARDYERMNLPDDAPIVRRVLRAAEKKGLAVRTRAMGGGCDANIFNQKGIEVANLGTGMRNIHSLTEYLVIDEMIQTAELIYEVVKLGADA